MPMILIVINKGLRTENHEQESEQRGTPSQHSQWRGNDSLIINMEKIPPSKKKTNKCYFVCVREGVQMKKRF